MPLYTTRHREFDYLQLRWLEKTTGRPSHDWDLYLVKELLDNALDADERCARQHGGPIELTVEFTHQRLAELGIYPLDITVQNGAPFPVEQLPAIFDLTAYTSDKSHYNYPSRGQQGNALKTILGIPYALHREFYSDYFNIRKPLVIETGEHAYQISLDIDEGRQVVQLLPVQRQPLREPCPGSRIRVGIDRFIQERPRSMADLQDWARRFALLNPQATFHWRVQLGQEQASWDLPGDPDWRGRFDDVAPVHWYDYTQLRELLLALERELGPEAPLPQVLQAFAGFGPEEDPEGQRARALCEQRGLHTLGDMRLISDHIRTLREGLWGPLKQQGRQIPAEQLGGVGEGRAGTVLGRFFQLDQPPLYRRIVHEDPADPAHPFVLELALARLPAGHKRTIWTGLNHTPTYEDPFSHRPLFPPRQPEEPVFGLDGFLDSYGQTADQPLLLVLHLISPNLGYQDFAKTVIDTRLYRQPLAEVLAEMLSDLGTVRAARLEDLQPLVHELLPAALERLSPGGRRRFSFPQLLRAVRRLLGQRLQDEGRGELAENWLGDPGANTRLQAYIQAYTREHPEAMDNLIQPERGRLSLRAYPEGYRTLALGQVDRATVEEVCADKLLLVSDGELEVVIAANGLLARFDMGMLRGEGNLETALEPLLPHLDRLGLPLLLLHHATPGDCLLAERLRGRLDAAGLAHIPLHDLGLTPAQGRRLNLPAEPGAGGGDRAALARYLEADEVAFLVDQGRQQSLHALTVDDMSAWIEDRLQALGLSPKCVPPEQALRSAALQAIRQVLGNWVLERFHEAVRAEFLIDQVIQHLTEDLRTDDLPAQLNQALRQQPLQSWRLLWSELVAERCRSVLARREDEVVQAIHDHRQALVDMP